MGDKKKDKRSLATIFSDLAAKTGCCTHLTVCSIGKLHRAVGVA